MVAATHAKTKAKNKVAYDDRQFQQEFEVGHRVLWYAPQKEGKLYCHWRGPYIVTEKVSPVRYKLRAEDNNKDRVDASIQHMILFNGSPLRGQSMDDEDAVVEHRIKKVWDQLKRGSFVAFKFPGDR